MFDFTQPMISEFLSWLWTLISSNTFLTFVFASLSAVFGTWFGGLFLQWHLTKKEKHDSARSALTELRKGIWLSGTAFNTYYGFQSQLSGPILSEFREKQKILTGHVVGDGETDISLDLKTFISPQVQIERYLSVVMGLDRTSPKLVDALLNVAIAQANIERGIVVRDSLIENARTSKDPIDTAAYVEIFFGVKDLRTGTINSMYEDVLELLSDSAADGMYFSKVVFEELERLAIQIVDENPKNFSRDMVPQLKFVGEPKWLPTEKHYESWEQRFLQSVERN